MGYDPIGMERETLPSPEYCPSCPEAQAKGIGCKCGQPLKSQGLDLTIKEAQEAAKRIAARMNPPASIQMPRSLLPSRELVKLSADLGMMATKCYLDIRKHNPGMSQIQCEQGAAKLLRTLLEEVM